MRQLVGYARYEGQAACDTLNALYRVGREVGKERVESRVLAAEAVREADKEMRRVAYAPLRPVALRRVLAERQGAVWQRATVRIVAETTKRAK